MTTKKMTKRFCTELFNFSSMRDGNQKKETVSECALHTRVTNPSETNKTGSRYPSTKLNGVIVTGLLNLPRSNFSIKISVLTILQATAKSSPMSGTSLLTTLITQLKNFTSTSTAQSTSLMTT